MRVVLHLLVLVVLIGAFGASAYADRYYSRGVATEADLAPIPYTDLNPLGVNTFLHEEPNPERVEQTLDMIADGGFGFIRQMFPWYDIELAPGSFDEGRWDDAVSTWDKYDRIVDLAEERGIQIIARIDKPPRWAREGQPYLDEFPDGPPNDFERFAEFVATVVERYRDRITYYQIWNEPNLQNEWGGQPIDPAAFTELLRVSYVAVKDVDPGAIVLMPGLAPTDQTGPYNLSELRFLEGMYEAGAADYFDIATVMVYGYGYSPWDRRVSPERNNFSRPIQTREIMLEHGDGHKPVWAAEYGWVSLPEDWQGHDAPWGRPVDAETQAEYLYEGYLRARQEWPWMGVMNIWNFRWTFPPDHPDHADNPTRGFSIVEHDFTPRPAYERLAGDGHKLDRAYTGAYDGGSRLIQTHHGWEREDRDGFRLLTPRESGALLEIPFHGSRIDLLLDGAGEGFAVTIDGQAPEHLPRDGEGRAILQGEDAEQVTVAEDLRDGPHTLELTALSGDNSLAIAGFTISRDVPSPWSSPWIDMSIGGLIVLNLASLLWAVRRPASQRQPAPSAPVGSRPRVRRAAELRAERERPRDRDPARR